MERSRSSSPNRSDATWISSGTDSAGTGPWSGASGSNGAAVGSAVTDGRGLADGSGDGEGGGDATGKMSGSGSAGRPIVVGAQTVARTTVTIAIRAKRAYSLLNDSSG